MINQRSIYMSNSYDLTDEIEVIMNTIICLIIEFKNWLQKTTVNYESRR